jgi:KDO2-lipid IV(A) lauroyltransferase
MKHWLEYALVRFLMAIVKVSPEGLVRALGTTLGLAFYTVDRSHRRIAERNLATAFPARPAAERKTIARNMFKHFGRMLFALLKFSTLTHEEMMARVDVDGEDRVRLAYAQGKGVLFVTGHFGYWEVNGLLHGLVFEPIAVMARALDNPRLNQLLEDIRRRTGNSVIYRRGAIRRVMRTLEAGKGVAVLIDQHIMGRDAIYVDFFSRPAATTAAVAALALRTGAAVVPSFAFPLPGGRIRLVYDHPVAPPRPDAPDAARDFTQRCTDVLEMYVRRDPEMWLWMHRRWRDNQVAGEATPGMFPPADSDD